MAVRSLGLPAADASSTCSRVPTPCGCSWIARHDAKRDFALTDRNAAAVAAALSAPRRDPARDRARRGARALADPEDLVARLDQRFKLLTRGSRAALERHQTLRNTIDWSYDLLGEHEREALNRLSVFAGGADLAAAEAVVSGRLARRVRRRRRAEPARRQVARRRRRGRRRRAVPAARVDPPVRAGAARGRGRRRRGAPPPRRLLRRACRGGRPASAWPRPDCRGRRGHARHRQLPRRARLGRRDAVARPCAAPRRCRWR